MTKLQIVSKNLYNNTIHSDKFTFASYDKIVIHQLDSIKVISIAQIEYIQASGNYSTIHMVDGSQLLTSRTLKSIFDSLDNSFVKTHKSFVINIKFISEYLLSSAEIVMDSSKKVLVSRANKRMIRDMLS